MLAAVDGNCFTGHAPCTGKVQRRRCDFVRIRTVPQRNCRALASEIGCFLPNTDPIRGLLSTCLLPWAVHELRTSRSRSRCAKCWFFNDLLEKAVQPTCSMLCALDDAVRHRGTTVITAQQNSAFRLEDENTPRLSPRRKAHRRVLVLGCAAHGMAG